MSRLFSELGESIRIAWTQILANRTRSALTALGVVIGIIAVTLMGTAINGIDTGFDRSLSLLGDDVLYVTKYPWGPREDFTLFRNRPRITTNYAEKINRIIADTPNSLLEIAVPAPVVFKNVTREGRKVESVYTLGTTSDFTRTSSTECERGRFLTESESRGAASVCVIGLDIANSLFPFKSFVKIVFLCKPRFFVPRASPAEDPFYQFGFQDGPILVPNGTILLVLLAISFT